MNVPAEADVIETTALTKHFGAVIAVEGLELRVRRNEVFGFLGPNGAGKTTTIRMLLDFLRPTSGAIRVLGGTAADPAVRARIGYLPAELGLPSRYRVRELLEFLGRVRGGQDVRRLVDLLDRFDLDPHRRIGDLSTGNRRKVGIVAAFVHRPELLILDEPTSGLDPLLQDGFHDLVGESIADGATVLLSSHLLPEVELLADRVAILRAGSIVATASPAELRGHAQQRIQLTLAKRVDAASFLAGVAGVVSVTVRGRLVDLVVRGSVDAALKAAATLAIEGISTSADDLREAFLGFYGGEAGDPS